MCLYDRLQILHIRSEAEHKCNNGFYKNINSFIQNMIVVCLGKTKDCYGWHHGRQTQFLAGGGGGAPAPSHLQADIPTCWLLFVWLTAWHSWIKKLPHYIFFQDPHTFFLFTQFTWLLFAVPYLSEDTGAISCLWNSQ